MSAVRFFDETDFCVGWSSDDDPLRRSSHALAVDGRVYVVDPVEGEGVDGRIRALGQPAAVLVLLDRHRRDSDAFAARFGVPVHETPSEPIAGAPFEFRAIARSRFWREVALWWPERRVLAVADALGTVGYFRVGDEALGVHPFLRLRPPRKALAGLQPAHILVGHGEGLHGQRATVALGRALGRARRNLPRAALSLVRGRR